MVVPREEELFVSTPAMMSWMTASARIRRKLSYRDAMSSLVLIGNQGTGQRWEEQVLVPRSTPVIWFSSGSPRVQWRCRLLNLSSFTPKEAMTDSPFKWWLKSFSPPGLQSHWGLGWLSQPSSFCCWLGSNGSCPPASLTCKLLVGN